MLERMEKFNVKANVLYISIFIFFAHVSCKRNPPVAHDPKTVNKYFNGPYLGYFLSELYEIFNITSIYGDI